MSSEGRGESPFLWRLEIMEILKYAVMVILIVVFTLCALAIRNDPNNDNPIATLLFALSMALLCCVRW